MLEIKILKEDSKSIIKNCGYHLTWVNITHDQNKKKFEENYYLFFVCQIVVYSSYFDFERIS